MNETKYERSSERFLVLLNQLTFLAMAADRLYAENERLKKELEMAHKAYRGELVEE